MVNSFMESSDRSFSLKGSEAGFTLEGHQQHLYHFGGMGTHSVECNHLKDPPMSNLFPATIPLSRGQCVLLPSFGDSVCLIFGGRNHSEERVDSFIEYDFRSNKATPLPHKLSEPKSGFGAAVREGKLYIAGGSNSLKALKAFEEYNLSTHKNLFKQSLPNMHQARDELGLTLGFDGYLYACGGVNESSTVLSSCERYSWDKGKWESIPSMNKPRHLFGLVSMPHGLYAIGGYDGHECLKTVELFDFGVGKWVTLASMSCSRFAFSAVVTNGLQYIIVSGGYQYKALKSTEIFDVIN
jgi:hypothetical protein